MKASHPLGRRASRTLLAAVAATTLLAVGTACAPSESPVATGGTLTIAQEIPPVLDPAFMESDRVRTILMNLYEPLLHVSADGSIEPGLAESWESSEDGTVWTFTIRSDAKFSDGSPLTAEDVRYSLVRALTPISAEEQQALGVQTSSPKGLAVLPDVVGVADIQSGAADALPEDAITATDERTLVITLTGPSSDILARLAYPALGAVQQANVEGAEGDQPWWYAPVSSGPFEMTEFEPESLTTLVPNEDFYGTTSGLDAVEFRVIADSQTGIVAWEADEMDIVKVLTSEVENLRSSGYEEQVVSSQDAQTVVLLANPIGPTSDMHVLRALAMAIDKETLASALDDLVTPAYTFTSPIIPGYDMDGVPLLEFDVDAARAELDESDFAGQPITINVNMPGSLDSRALPIIAQMWEQNLGITVNILNELPPATAPQEQAANLLLLTQGPNYTGICAMARRWPDFLTFAGGANNVNFGAIDAPGLAGVVEDCTTAPDEAAAWESVREFETLLTENPQFIPMWYGNSYYLVNDAVQNLRFGNNWQIANLPEVGLAAE